MKFVLSHKIGMYFLNTFSSFRYAQGEVSDEEKKWMNFIKPKKLEM